MNLAFGLAGAAVGSFFGMTSIGWSIGAWLGSQFAGTDDVSLPAQTGPRLTDLKVQTSTYGNMIPIIYGTARAAGNMTWLRAGHIDEIATTQVVGGGGGGGKGDTPSQPTQEVTTFSYFATFAVTICEGPRSGLGVIGIRKIWMNGELTFDVSAGGSLDPSLLANMVFYPGTETQGIDPAEEADHPGLTPAYRGFARVVFYDLPLERFGNRIPNIEFEVVVTGSNQYMVPTELYTLPTPHSWTDQFDEGNNPQTRRNSPGAEYFWAIEDTGSPDAPERIVAYSNFSHQAVMTHEGSTGAITFAGTGYNGRMWVQEHGIGSIGDLYTVSLTGEKIVQIAGGIGFVDGDNRMSHVYEFPEYSDEPEHDPMFFLQYNHPLPGIHQVFRFDAGAHTGAEAELINTGRDSTVFITSADRIAGRIYLAASIDGNGVIGYVDLEDNSNTFVPIRNYDQSTQPWAMVGIDGYIYARSVDINDANILEKMDPEGNIIDTLVLTGLSATSYAFETQFTQDSIGRLYVQVDRGLWRINYGTMTLLHTATLAHNDDWILPGDTYLGTGVFCIRVEGDPSDPNNVVRILADTLTPSPPLLSEIVQDLCERVGLGVTDIDVTDLASTTVTGFVIGRRMTARAALEVLMGVYFFEAVESDYKIKFVMRGNSSVVTIPEEELAARGGKQLTNPPDNLKTSRKQEMELPVQADLSYLDQAIDYQISMQPSRRLTTQSKQLASMQAPVVLTATEAKQKVDTQLFNAWIEREAYEFSTSRKYAKYEPTDVAIVEKDGIPRGMRFVQKDEGVDGTIQWRAVAEVTSVYSQSSVGSGPGGGVGSIPVTGATNAMLLDIPLLRAVDDTNGFYLAAHGWTDGWRGVQLFWSNDNGVTYQVTTDGRLVVDSTMGTTTTALGDYPDTETNAMFDEFNSVTVSLFNGTVSSVTDEELAEGANFAVLGNEIIQFRDRTIDQVGPPLIVTLSGLLRGRLGSESFMSDHVVGERFVLLTENTIATVGQALSKRNILLPFKPVSIGATVDQTARVDFKNTGRRLKPPAPWHPRAGKRANGDVVFEFDRRTRYDASWTDGADAPLGETTESYDILVYDHDTGDTLLGVIEADSEPYVCPLNDQLDIFGSELGFFRFEVCQMSSAVGRGYPSRKVTADLVVTGAHRYWRQFNMNVASGGSHYEVSEIRLLQGVQDISDEPVWSNNMGIPATGPLSLALAHDEDGNTRFQVDTATTENASSYIKWDFGDTPRRITAMQQGGYDTANRILEGFELQWSDDDSNWTSAGTQAGLTYPGNFTLSEEYLFT